MAFMMLNKFLLFLLSQAIYYEKVASLFLYTILSQKGTFGLFKFIHMFSQLVSEYLVSLYFMPPLFKVQKTHNSEGTMN